MGVSTCSLESGFMRSEITFCELKTLALVACEDKDK